MEINGEQGKNLKKKLIGKSNDVTVTIRTLDEVVLALHKNGVFENKKTVPIVLNRPEGLDLTYHSRSEVMNKGVKVISIRRDGSNPDRYVVSHYFKKDPTY